VGKGIVTAQFEEISRHFNGGTEEKQTSVSMTGLQAEI
jgi:hypothetical protein